MAVVVIKNIVKSVEIRLWDVNTGEGLRTLRGDRPYEDMNITRVMGIIEGQKATLEVLGANRL